MSALRPRSVWLRRVGGGRFVGASCAKILWTYKLKCRAGPAFEGLRVEASQRTPAWRTQSKDENSRVSSKGNSGEVWRRRAQRRGIGHFRGGRSGSAQAVCRGRAGR